MELKYESEVFVHLTHHRSNRTFMELKFVSWMDLEKLSAVLIVPLWN